MTAGRTEPPVAGPPQRLPRAAEAALPVRHAAGFTLIELVAATALSAVLLTTVLAVVRTVNRPDPAGAAPDDAPLARQLRWDLANAVVLRTDAGGLTLAGHGSLDPDTLEPTGRPVVVTYSVRPAGGRNWLVREQASLDRLAEGGPWAELAAADVAGLTVDAPPTAADRAAATQPADDDPTPLAFQRLAGVRPVPPRVRVTVRFAGRPSCEVVAFR